MQTETNRGSSGSPVNQHASSSQNSLKSDGGNTKSNAIEVPSISLPKGGGAIKGIGEKFAANPVTGTGSMSAPVALSSGRSGFGPKLSLSYDSGAGMGLFGLGWQIGLPGISRKTDKGLPQYLDNEESDVFLLSGAEDLVPVIQNDNRVMQNCRLAGKNYAVYLYIPRIEGLFAQIERWVEINHPENCFWRSISRDNITTWYGRDTGSRIYDPENPSHIYQWLISQVNDDKGNLSLYKYTIPYTNNQAAPAGVWEMNRNNLSRQSNRYIKRILYGNRQPYLPKLDPELNDDTANTWMFEAVFDYGDHNEDNPLPAPDLATPNNNWPVCMDAFSQHRAGFEIRTDQRCRRILMFHHFPEDNEVGLNCLVKSTNLDYQLADTLHNPLQPGYTTLQSVTHRSYQRNQAAGAGPAYYFREMPPVTFHYSVPVINETLQTIDPSQLQNLPAGTQGSGYRWIDLDGEGISGVLAEQQGAWYYKSNLGDGNFGALHTVNPVPSLALAGNSSYQFMDLAGNGEIDVVDFGGINPGFYERDTMEGWKNHKSFISLPNINWQDPNLRFLDITGDGHADAFITEQDVFTWYPSLDESGFAAARKTCLAIDEDAGPRLVFADAVQTIFLADMCGDGLTDLVRIRNGDICYWPNMGYGRFGRKVTLGNAPRFDTPDLFDPTRIRLADIDGSGPIDIIYLGRNGAHLYFNRSGNCLSNPFLVNLPLATENLGAAQVADLLGNGTACLVWNSHLPGDAGQPVYYIDLMGGPQDTAAQKAFQRKHEKPHLLIKVENNLGGTTEIEYTPSTRFYLADKLNGTPWITRLPFPVHCVSRVTTLDKWRKTRFSSTYSYHHGFFDGTEREFRGFGRVEQVDIEDYGEFQQQNKNSPWIAGDNTLFQPPIKSVTWYHTGAALDRKKILNQFEQEYFPQVFAKRLSPAATAFYERPLPEPALPAGINAAEWRQALRACKGMVLRQEVYELDLKDFLAAQPKHTPVRLFTAATHNCHIQLLQKQAGNRHAVFLATESEALSYNYELTIPKDGSSLHPDPRISHSINISNDKYGNPQQSVAIGYHRWQEVSYGYLTQAHQMLIAAVQAEAHMAYTESHYTADTIQNASSVTNSPVRHHRLRLPYEVLSFELKGINKKGDFYFSPADFSKLHLSDVYGPQLNDTPAPVEVLTKAYHEIADRTVPQKRLVEHTRSRFFNDANDDVSPDYAAPLPFGQHGPRGLKYEDYKLALTTDLLQAIFQQKDGNGRVTDDKLGWLVEAANAGLPAKSVLDKLNDSNTSGYLRGSAIGLHPDEYWIRSGTAGFAADAHQHFFLPERYTDPFGNTTRLELDPLDLFILSSEDAMGNRTAIARDTALKPRFNYRLLAPIEMIDANDNHSEAVFDIHGLVVAAAIKGKLMNGIWEGDQLEDLVFEQINPPENDIASFCGALHFDAAMEQKARYWLGTASTRFVYHFGESRNAANQPVWQNTMPVACAIIREIHSGQPGGAISPLQIGLECADGSGNTLMKKQQAEPDKNQTNLRWLINGLTVLNNKGKPVKQYEPAFSDFFGPEMPQANGVTPVMYYDSAGRVMRTDFPDGTFSRVLFSPWDSEVWDQNDTVLESQWYADKLPPAPQAALPTNATASQRAAWLAAQHAATPARAILDSLGREVIAIAQNRVEDTTGPLRFDDRQWKNEFYCTFSKLDAEGKPLWIMDAMNSLVMQYIYPYALNNRATAQNFAPCYDIAGNLLFQHSMDAGDRWTINDATGKPLFAWDLYKKEDTAAEQKRLYASEYDALHRPTGRWLKLDEAPPIQIERFDYCDSTTATGDMNPQLDQYKATNLIGQLLRHYDSSGMVETIAMDFKGNPLEIQRRLVIDHQASVTDWQINRPAQLNNAAVFTQITRYDALKRMTALFNWHKGNGSLVAVYIPQYNERAVLKGELLVLGAVKDSSAAGYTGGTITNAIAEIRYDAKGQRQYLQLGNGISTSYNYDPQTFRLTHLRSQRPIAEICGAGSSSILADPLVVQNLSYWYDPAGNITEIKDAAYKTVFYNGQKVAPINQYTYDALYRLVYATGRENSAALGAPSNKEDKTLVNQFPCVADNAFRNYTQQYKYDAAGNIKQMMHITSDPNIRWTRNYAYALEDAGHPASNRLMSTTAGNETIHYQYDGHGSMLNLLNSDPKYNMQWDHQDMIRDIDLGGGGHVYYQYDAAKQRTRKTIVKDGSTEERIYLGGLELYRRKDANGNTLEEIETLHLFDGEQRLLMVDEILITEDSAGPRHLYRYTLSNHLGSSTMDFDQQAELISYEEYHPYGTTAFRSGRNEAEVNRKRYRYTGMERDEESGLAYHSARYYMIWLGRWLSADPIGIGDGVNVYTYALTNPIKLKDGNGYQSVNASNKQASLASTYLFLKKSSQALMSYAEKADRKAFWKYHQKLGQERVDFIKDYFQNLDEVKGVSTEVYSKESYINKKGQLKFKTIKNLGGPTTEPDSLLKSRRHDLVIEFKELPGEGYTMEVSNFKSFSSQTKDYQMRRSYESAGRNLTLEKPGMSPLKHSGEIPMDTILPNSRQPAMGWVSPEKSTVQVSPALEGSVPPNLFENVPAAPKAVSGRIARGVASIADSPVIPMAGMLLIGAVFDKSCEGYAHSDQALVDWKLGLLDEEPPVVKEREEENRISEEETKKQKVQDGIIKKLSATGASFGVNCPACQ